jgi:starch phosphorylase
MDSLFTGPWVEEHRRQRFQPICAEIIHARDTYFILQDLASYIEAQEKINKLYQDKTSWQRMCLINIASSGFFSSDRTIEQYVHDIWHLDKLVK